jgi:Flp pilus assembly secretin CpaC
MAGKNRIELLSIGLGAALAFATSIPSPASAGQPIEVVMNEAKILRLANEASTVVVGNPAIADAAVQDSKTIVLTGKGFGATNVVILDSNGSPILDEHVVVKRSDVTTMRIYRRDNVATLSCTPYCESAFKSEAEAASDASVSN